MNWLDVVLVLILLLSIMTSFRQGLTREIIKLVSVVLAILLGIWLYGFVGGHLLPYLSSPAIAHFAGFAIVFCVVLWAGTLLSFIVGRFLKVTGLSIFDHVLGAGFGFVRGVLICVALVMGMMAFAQGERAPEAIVQSRLAPYAVDAADVLAAVAPHELREGVRESYERVKTAWEQGIQKRIGPNGEKKGHERQI